MKCAACGYDTSGGDPEYYGPPGDQFVEILGLERGPLHYETQTDGFTTQAVARGFPTRAYACPQCGTVRIEV